MSRLCNNDRTPDSNAQYEDCIVSFIDVLGFRELLRTRSAVEVHDIIMLLRKFTWPEDEGQTQGMKDVRLMSRAFAESVSDAVVRVRVFDTQYRDGAFHDEILNLLHAQVACIASNVLIRGGVAVGQAHVGPNGEGPVFGPAMVRAFEIESQEALFPRIAVDDTAYQQFLTDPRLRSQHNRLQQEREHVDALLCTGEDETRYIDYLRASEAEFDSPELWYDFLHQHAELVRGGLEVTDGRVRRKYHWLAHYQNKVVNERLAWFSTRKDAAQDFETEFNIDPVPYLEECVIGK